MNPVSTAPRTRDTLHILRPVDRLIVTSRTSDKQLSQKTASPIHTSLFVSGNAELNDLCSYDVTTNPFVLHVRVCFVLVLPSMDTPRCAQERHFHLCASSARETGDEANCASGSHTSLSGTQGLRQSNMIP